MGELCSMLLYLLKTVKKEEMYKDHCRLLLLKFHKPNFNALSRIFTVESKKFYGDLVTMIEIVNHYVVHLKLI